ncbi:hypothetical protein BDR07DRAFT_1493624 [Suillus spraguei]|nr:hypothetical protein BDR07DRAFT_1493624 [Suillus spraguei]
MPPLNMLSLADLKQTQLELQELKDFNKELTEENKILKANQLKQKKKGQNISEEHMAFDEEIRLCGCKYGACYEMFAPDRQLLQRPNPTFAPPLNEPSRYETQASAESALIAELFSLLPSHIHHLVGDNHFADILEDAMNSSRASEIKKLCSKAGLIFGLPEHIPEIQCLLGTSTSQRMPKPFLPILFPNLVEDPLLKTVFGNWEIFGKVIFLLSANKEFRYSSKGETTKIHYNHMFSSYKKILVKNWNTEYIMTNSTSDEEDFTAAMDHALAGVVEGEASTARPEPVIEDIMDKMVADVEANRDTLRPNSPLKEPDEDEVIWSLMDNSFAVQQLLLDKDEAEHFNDDERLMVLAAAIIAGSEVSRQERIDTRHPHHLYLCQPQLLPNPRINTPWKALRKPGMRHQYLVRMSLRTELQG